jgi:ubiquinone/menaquinone biosynthesis C-methylase UbiE
MPRWHSRGEEQDPGNLLSGVGLERGMTFADIGCGSGYSTIPAAEIVGETGEVYAVDVDVQSVEHLRRQAEERGLENIVSMVGRGEDTVFCEGCIDLVFLGIVLHDFQDPGAVLRNARRMLKADGRLVNLDWRKIRMDFGPPYHIRFDEEKAGSLLRHAGFRIEEVRDEGRYHYVIRASLA